MIHNRNTTGIEPRKLDVVEANRAAQYDLLMMEYDGSKSKYGYEGISQLGKKQGRQKNSIQVGSTSPHLRYTQH